MLKKFTNKKGFTLMEMLIVVAIIAVLIAIAIPTFASQLNKARVSTDEANIRSGYADVMLKILTEEDGPVANNTTFTLKKDGTVATGTVGAADAYKTKGDSGTAVEISGVSVNAWSKDKTVTYTVVGGKVSKIEAK